MQRTLFHMFGRHALRSANRLRVLALAAAIVNLAGAAFAQQWFTLTIDEKAKGDRNVALSCFKDPAAYAANKQRFDNYFQNYIFPSMTRFDPDGLGALAKLKDEILKPTKTGNNTQALQDLTTATFKAMGQIVGKDNPPAHPAVRYNAVLIMGQLDQKYSDGRTPPEPLAAATKALTTIVDSATTGNRFPPVVIFGAVVGLERHAQYKQSLPADAVTAMTAALIKLAAHEDPIQEMDRSSYSWLRLRAANALAKLGTPGDKNSIHDAIVKLASSGKSMDDRCAAAALLERIDYKNTKLDDAGTAEPMFKLARDLAAASAQQAQDFQDKKYTSGNLSTGPLPRGPGAEGGFGGPGASLESFETFPRRQVLSRLVDYRTGLKKIKDSLTPESQKKVDAVMAALNQTIGLLSEKSTAELTMADELIKMSTAINTAVPGPAAPPEKPADTKAAEEKAFD
jgi:hypothetical protein